MRLVSQDGFVDVNYDNGALMVSVGKYEECVTAIITYYDHSSQRGTRMAEYNSKAKSIKVMDMLRNQYQRIWEIENGFVTPGPVHNHIFIFPKDEEVEV